MNRVIMKNGDVVNLETYQWNRITRPIQIATITRELEAKARTCLNDYPGQKIRFSFNTEFGTLPQQIRTALEKLGIEVETWP